MDREYREVGYPCHKYIMRCLNTKNEQRVAEFAKSYYLLFSAEKTDQEILSELFLLGEYSMLTIDSVRPDFLKRNGIAYQEKDYFISLVKDSSVRELTCEELQRVNLKKEHICTLCSRSQCYTNAYLLEYEKVLRTLFQDMRLLIEFKAFCERESLDSASFFIPRYELGELFTIKRPVTLPLLQYLYDIYEKNSNSLLLTGMMDYLKQSVLSKAVDLLVKDIRLPDNIKAVENYKDIIRDFYYDRIFLQDSSIYSREEFLSVLATLGQAFSTVVPIPKNGRGVTDKKTAASNPRQEKKKKEATPRTSTKKKKEEPLYQEVTLCDLLSAEEIGEEEKKICDTAGPSLEIPKTMASAPDKITASLDKETAVMPDKDSTGDADSFTAVSSASASGVSVEIPVQEEKDVSLLPVVSNKKTAARTGKETSGGPRNDTITFSVEVVPSFQILQLPDYIKLVHVQQDYFIRKELPVVCEVVYDKTAGKEYLLFGNMTNHASRLYGVEMADRELVAPVFHSMDYEKICYNAFTLCRFLSGCTFQKERVIRYDYGYLPMHYHSLDDYYFFRTKRRTSVKITLIRLTNCPLATDILNILSSYQTAYRQMRLYLQRDTNDAVYSFYREEMNVRHYSYARYRKYISDIGSNIVCQKDGHGCMEYTSHIPKLSLRSGTYIHMKISGVPDEPNQGHIHRKFIHYLLARNYFERYQVFLLYHNDFNYTFYCVEEDSTNILSYMEVELLEISRSFGCRITLSQSYTPVEGIS